MLKVGFFLGLLFIGFLFGMRRDKNSYASKFGEFRGISPGLASQGKTFEESQLCFVFNKTGLILDAPLEKNGRMVVFKIHFPTSWVFSLKGWDVDKGVAIRQHAESKLAQFILLYTEDFQSFRQKLWHKKRADVTMILGEGMPAVLGVFLRQPCSEKDLKEIYDQAYKPPAPKPANNWLMSIDVSTAKETMELFGDSQAKIQLLEKATQNLWTGSSAVIKQRLELVALGLEDGDPEVQKQALRTFSLNGRVNAGVEMVVNFLKQPHSDEEVLAEALESATCLLYEAHLYNREVRKILTDFDTMDLEKIRDKTKGLLTPEQYEILNRINQRKEEVCWTADQENALRNAIRQIMASRLLPSKAMQIGYRALIEYPSVQ